VLKLKKLNAAAILICILAAYAVFEGIWAIAATEGFIQMWVEMMGTTVNESAVLTMAVQFFGVHHLVGFVSLAIIAVIPLRRAEKWAWLTILVLGGIGMGFGIALWAPYFPVMYVLLAVWIAALALSARLCLGKKE
jgi:hypothetical protein